MVDSEYSTDNYNSSNISIGVATKNPEILTFLPNNLKTKTMCKHAVKKLPCVIRHVPDQYKTQQMWNKAIIENSGTSDSVPICHKNQEIHDNPLDNYPRA